MKKLFTTFLLLFAIGMAAQAQKYALIDMEYILERIPAYQRANDQLENNSKIWQKEVDKVADEAKELYKNYQSQVSRLSDAQRGQKEEAIVAKEKQASDLRRKYFGPEGELYKQQNSLLQPIQDKIYEAVKQIATQRGYAMVWDRASTQSLIFASPSIDISNEVLSRLGYSN